MHYDVYETINRLVVLRKDLSCDDKELDIKASWDDNDFIQNPLKLNGKTGQTALVGSALIPAAIVDGKIVPSKVIKMVVQVGG